MKYIHQFIIVNRDASTLQPEDIKADAVIYEVLRVIEGVPMFVEKHMQRLENSASIMQKNLPFPSSEFINLIRKLIEINQVFEGNLKISIDYHESSSPIRSVIGFIPHHYPSVEDYRFGVKTITNQAKRTNPNAKVQNDNLRNEINKRIKEENAYEAILVHPDGYITEGSRSNLFFVKGNTIITSPDHQVLSGITRENVIELCKNQFPIVFEPLPLNDISTIDAAFITGTSPKVLPVKCIDDTFFVLPHPIIENLLSGYNQLITSYIASHQKK